MLKNLGIVQASFRLPRFRAMAARTVGGRSLLEWVIRRVTDSMRLDGVIVVTDQAADANYLRRFVPNDVPMFSGQENDSLSQINRAVEQCPAEGVVRVRGDSLFVDPSLIDRLVNTAEAHPTCDYVSYCLRDGRPAVLSPVGIYAEWFRTSALRTAYRKARSLADREHVTHYFCSHPDQFQLRLIPAPDQMDRDDVRLVVDREEDWEHALAIYDALGPERLDWQGIAALLGAQPALRNRMAVLNRDGVHV